MSKTISFLPIKLQRSKDHIRRFRLEDVMESSESEDPYDVLITFIKTSFPDIPDFYLRYKDEEDDDITVGRKEELIEGFSVAQEQNRKTLRLFLIEGKANKIEKVKTPVQTCELRFGDKVADLQVPEDSKDYSTIQQLIESMFPELKNCLVLKYLDDEQDMVTIKSDDEVTEAFELFKSNPDDMGEKLVFVAEKKK